MQQEGHAVFCLCGDCRRLASLLVRLVSLVCGGSLPLGWGLLQSFAVQDESVVNPCRRVQGLVATVQVQN